MTTHPVPIGTHAMIASLTLSPENVDGDPYDRPVRSPLPVRVPGRAKHRQDAVDSIRALADFYDRHPEVPAPVHVVATAWVAGVEQLAAVDRSVAGAHVYGEGRQMDYEISTSANNVWTQARVAVRTPDRAL